MGRQVGYHKWDTTISKWDATHETQPGGGGFVSETLVLAAFAPHGHQGAL